DRIGGAPSVVSSPPPTEPGTRFARGTRFGSPAVVVSPASGDATIRAARHPSSAGEFQLCPAAGAAAELSGLPLRRNQSDSRESKMGSRWSVAAPTVGGIVTWLPSEPPTPLLPAGEVEGTGPVPTDPPSPPSAGILVVAKSLSPKLSPPNAEPPPLDGAPGPSGWLPGVRTGSGPPGASIVPLPGPPPPFGAGGAVLAGPLPAPPPKAPKPPLFPFPLPLPAGPPPPSRGILAAVAAAPVNPPLLLLLPTPGPPGKVAGLLKLPLPPLWVGADRDGAGP